MSKFFLCLLAVLPITVLAGSGQYHVCTDDAGRKTFTSEPCSDDEQSEIRSYSVTSGAASTSPRLTTGNPIYQKMKSDNRQADIKREIKALKKKTRKLGADMESDLALLRRKKLRANNNGAGATWEVSISEEMSAVTQKYTTLIDLERDRLNELNVELSQLN